MNFSRNDTSEGTYDEIGFIIDADCEGNKHPLTRKSVLFGRDRPIISDRSLQAKTE